MNNNGKINNDNIKEYEPSTAYILARLTLVTGTGALRGFYNAKGITLNPDLENLLCYAPVLARTVDATIKNEGVEYLKRILEKNNTQINKCTLKVSCATAGAINGALQTLVGYAIGYVIGNLSK